MSKGTVLTKKNFKENIRKLNEKIVVLGLAQGLLEDVLMYYVQMKVSN